MNNLKRLKKLLEGNYNFKEEKYDYFPTNK